MDALNNPFDLLAADYDAAFTASPIARYLRKQVQERLLGRFTAGTTILELGCGTGEDARFLAQQGRRVLATDASTQMLERTRAKLHDLPNTATAALHLDRPDDFMAPAGFADPWDGAFSNFGALNCLTEWRSLAGWLAARIHPGGILGLGMMAPYCLWEIAWHGLHGDWRTAGRRLCGSSVFQPAATAAPIVTTYPTIRRITRDFAPYFRRVFVMPLGVCLPPTDAYGVIEKRPRWLKRLLALEARATQHAWLALLADHYWIELQRTNFK